MKNERGNTVLVLIMIILLIVLAFWYFMKNGYKVPNPIGKGTPTVQNASDLDTASAQLDNTDLNQMDPEMTQLSSDSSSF